MKIKISGPVLHSLRTRYKASVDIASRMAKVQPDEWEEWERNGTELNITQARDIAKKFHAHWSIFLLETPVKEIKEPINHRAGYADYARFSMDTLRAYEIARELLDASVEIEGQTVDRRLIALKKSFKRDNAPAQYSKLLRQYMDVTYESLKDVTASPSEVYKYWRERISSLGIYVSEQAMPEEETKAFLLEDGDRAVIVVNKNDRYPHSKTFSLLHELGHLIRGDSSAACLVTISATRVTPSESWCNKFASEIIVPEDELLSDPLADTVLNADEPNEIIRALSTKYRASFTVVMYKLLQNRKITRDQCAALQAFFESVILPKFAKKPKNNEPIKLGKIFYVRKDVSKSSVSLAREVIDRQMSGAITYSDAARLLGTKVKYIEDIKSVVGFGS